MRRTRLAIASLALLAACGATSPDVAAVPAGQTPLAANLGLSTASGPSSSSDTGTVFIAVTSVGGAPVAGARVELGSWEGSAQAFRDSAFAGVMLPSATDARFHLLASAMTGADGRVRFAALEKKQTFAARAMPASGSGAYFASLFWLYTSPTMDLSIRVAP